MRVFEARWHQEVRAIPSNNPNLTIAAEDYSLPGHRALESLGTLEAPLYHTSIFSTPRWRHGGLHPEVWPSVRKRRRVMSFA